MAAKLSHHEVPSQRVYFIFTFRELSLLEEFYPVLSKLRELDPQEQFFSYRFYLTRTPSDSLLDQPIDYARITGKSSSDQPTTYDAAAATGKSGQCHPTLFAEPLRTQGFKPVMFLLITFVAVFLVAWLEYGNGRIVDGGKKSQLWMVQYTVEISVLFLCTLVVYAVILIEQMMKQRNGNTSNAMAIERDTSKLQDYYVTDALTYTTSDGPPHAARFMASYDVTIGSRPDMDELIQEVSAGHNTFVSQNKHQSDVHNGVIGVFISGPEALKTATEYAIAKLGSQRFDLHAEEFEL